MPKKKIKPANRLFDRVKTERKKKFGNKYRNILIILLCSVFLCVLIIYSIVFFSQKPSNSLSNEAKVLLTIPREDLQSTLVVLEASNNKSIVGAWYVLYNKKNAFTMVYAIPQGVYMKDYLQEISSFVSVGELKYIGSRINESREYEYAIWQLGNLTGMTPDSYIWLNLDSLTSFSKLFGDVSEYKKADFSDSYINGESLSLDSYMISSLFKKYNFLRMFLDFKNYKSFVNGIDSNLSTYELFNRIKSVKNALSGKGIYMLDLTQLWATQPMKQVSGKDINVINYSEVDIRLEDVVKNLKGRELEREQVKIEIYNASEEEGLALRYSRKFENSGIDVVRYENSPTLEDVTKIYVSKPEIYDHSLALVKKLLAVNPEVITKRPDYMTTGDIVVVLGKDVAKQVRWK